MTALLLIPGAFLVVATLLYLYVTRHFRYWRRRGVPGPKPAPPFGNFKEPLFQTVAPGVFLRDLYNAHPDSPCVGFFIIDKPVLLLRDPGLIKRILTKDFSYFMDRYADSSMKSDSIGARNMFLSNGSRWRQLRNGLSPAFTSGRTKKMYYFVLDIATQLRSHLVGLIEVQGSTTVEVKELMAKATTDVISTCAFGINSNCIADPNAEFRDFGRSIFHYTFRRSLESTSMWFLPWLLKLANFSFYPKETSMFLNKVFWDTTRAREESGIPRNDAIDQLILMKNRKRTANDPKDTIDFQGKDLLAQAAMLFAAGFETTSSTLSFTLYELALQPGIQDRVRAEIRRTIADHGGSVTYDAVIEMKYLDTVIAETLRKYPPLPFLDRECVMEYTVPDTGLVIEKGTPVYIPLLGLHYDPVIFPDPDKYDPERFSDERKQSIPSGAYLPFGEGPRICLGMRFAQIAIKTELANMLANMEVVTCPDTPVPLQLNPKATLLASTGGIPLVFRHID